jgi:hypothetical protein
MGQGRRQFTDEFKREAVPLLASSGRLLTQTAAELGIAPSMIRNWDRSASTYPVSELLPRPRWRSARPGPHRNDGIDAPFFRPGFQSAGSTVRPSRCHRLQISVIAKPESLCRCGLAADRGVIRCR